MLDDKHVYPYSVSRRLAANAITGMFEDIAGFIHVMAGEACSRQAATSVKLES